MKNIFLVIFFIHFLGFASFSRSAEAAPSTGTNTLTEEQKQIHFHSLLNKAYEIITTDPLYPIYCLFIAKCPPSGIDTIATSWVETIGKNLEHLRRDLNTPIKECRNVVIEITKGFLIVINQITDSEFPALGENDVFGPEPEQEEPLSSLAKRSRP